MKDRPAADGETANRRATKTHYRVDSGYRKYQGRAGPSIPTIPTVVADDVKAVRVSSAELLDSMIHRMGGALTSSAKGTFVDITV